MNKTNLTAISGKAGSGKDLVGKIIQYLTSVSNPDPQEFDIQFYSRNVNIENSNWEIKKFAGKVKEVLCLLTGCTMKDLENEDFKNSYMPEEWNRCRAFVVIQGRTISSLLWPTEKKAHTKLLELVHDIDGWDTESIAYERIRMTYRQGLQWIGTDLFRDKFHPNTWCNSLFADYKNIYIGGIDPIMCTDKVEIVKIYPNWIITDLRFPNELEAVKERGGIVIRVNRPIARITKFSEHHSETALDDYEDWNYVIENDSDIPALIEKVREILIKESLI